MEINDIINVWFNSWAGHNCYKAQLIKINAKRSRVKWLEWSPKGEKGSESLVPNHAITANK